MIVVDKRRSDHDPLYDIWRGAMRRCHDKNRKDYHRYGGRGIHVCDEWRGTNAADQWTYQGFLNFRKWAFTHGYTQGLTLDRVCNNRGYSPDNCRWITSKQQNYNRRTNTYVNIDGTIHTIEEWSRIMNIGPDVICHRHYDRGWSWKDAVMVPKGQKRKKNDNEETDQCGQENN